MPQIKKKPLNEYFKLMLEAKKIGAPSFQYKGKTYYRSVAKNGLITYKKQ